MARYKRSFPQQNKCNGEFFQSCSTLPVSTVGCFHYYVITVCCKIETSSLSHSTSEKRCAEAISISTRRTRKTVKISLSYVRVQQSIKANLQNYRPVFKQYITIKWLKSERGQALLFAQKYDLLTYDALQVGVRWVITYLASELSVTMYDLLFWVII